MSVFSRLRQCVAEETAVTLATIVAGPRNVGAKILIFPGGNWENSLGDDDLTTQVAADAPRLLLTERSETKQYATASGEYEVFIDVYPPPRRLVIVGATDAAIALSRLAKVLGFHVVVTDARAAFARPERFPEADAVLKGWPQDVLPTLRFDQNTAVVLLSHDPKFDKPTLEHVLPTSVSYIGAIGSRKTQQERIARLRAEGHSEEQLARLHGPVGLNLGGRSPEETALAILAEIVAVRHGAGGESLRGSR
ncbi:MAG: XdhC family protein [Chloroflexota bacterium]